ncbi:hypothetical protein K0U00_20715, partial [Paenibacillus sepulcri]|nr:hypothetical protein [Paenibacillus sepulcri]
MKYRRSLFGYRPEDVQRQLELYRLEQEITQDLHEKERIDYEILFAAKQVEVERLRAGLADAL